MFEKEAEEYVMREDVITENDRVPFDNGYGFQTVSFEDEVKKGFKDGAEFGYNKANEWHDLRKDPKDLPNGYRVVLNQVGMATNYDPIRGLLGVGGVGIIAWHEIPIFKKG